MMAKHWNNKKSICHSACFLIIVLKFFFKHIIISVTAISEKSAISYKN